ncbi:MAG: hypothetical protein IJX81_00120 [Clostridia bacterium]|nr:hypothetical protein [Clostridia bacterium]
MKLLPLLTANPSLGAFWLIMLFAFSFFAVHLLLLAKAGWEAKREKREEKSQPPTKTEEPKKSPAPVYYLVEKKKKRPKSTYSQPREIHFN